jgi:hypothetical protein
MNARVAIAVLLTLLQAAGVAFGVWVLWCEVAKYGWLDYDEHFTYWSFTLQLLFYALTLPLPLVVALEYDGWPLRVVASIVLIMFVPLWGIVTAVTVIVFFELAQGSTLLDGYARTESASRIVVSNVIFHFATQLWLFAWVVVYQRATYWAYNWPFAQRAVRRSSGLFWSLVLTFMLYLPSIPLLLYAAIFNFHAVYQTSVSTALAALAVIAIVIVATSVLLFFLFLYHLGESPLPPAWIRASEFEALADRVVTSYQRWRHRRKD